MVREAYAAFARWQPENLRRLCDESLEFRPVDGLGLVGDVFHGLDEACDWIQRRFDLGYSVTIWLRTLEDVGNERVLGVGTVSETGRMGQGYAATVAWVWQVRDGRICSVFGYPGEAEARRSLTLSR